MFTVQSSLSPITTLFSYVGVDVYSNIFCVGSYICIAVQWTPVKVNIAIRKGYI